MPSNHDQPRLPTAEEVQRMIDNVNEKLRTPDHEYVHPDEGLPPLLRRIGAPCVKCGRSHQR